MATHDLNLAASMCGRAGCCATGVLLRHGTTAEVLNRGAVRELYDVEPMCSSTWRRAT
jgi:ABC-type cobalamin/Fe3+-siderophores transport system ATPase subunit